jgi:hypothetical protein
MQGCESVASMQARFAALNVPGRSEVNVSSRAVLTVTFGYLV